MPPLRLWHEKLKRWLIRFVIMVLSLWVRWIWQFHNLSIECPMQHAPTHLADNGFNKYWNTSHVYRHCWAYTQHFEFWHFKTILFCGSRGWILTAGSFRSGSKFVKKSRFKLLISKTLTSNIKRDLFCGHFEAKAAGTTLTSAKVYIANLSAKSCLFTRTADTEQRKHVFASVQLMDGSRLKSRCGKDGSASLGNTP